MLAFKRPAYKPTPSVGRTIKVEKISTYTLIIILLIKKQLNGCHFLHKLIKTILDLNFTNAFQFPSKNCLAVIKILP